MGVLSPHISEIVLGHGWNARHIVNKISCFMGHGWTVRHIIMNKILYFAGNFVKFLEKVKFQIEYFITNLPSQMSESW